jgi:ribosomal protein S18 acetylase RimI-like enzyme
MTVGVVIAVVIVVAVIIGLVGFLLQRRAASGLTPPVNSPVSYSPDYPTTDANGTVESTLVVPAESVPIDSSGELPVPWSPSDSADSPASRSRRREAQPVIREADAADQSRLADIEAQSVQGLAGSGLGALPSPGLRDEESSAAVLLVAGRPAVAFIRVDEVDGLAHIDQLAVLPSVARQGIGKSLMDAAIEWATQHGYPAMTLSTFAASEWNARVYDATGFRPLEQLTPGLRELRDWERAIGLDSIGARVVMRRELSV